MHPSKDATSSDDLYAVLGIASGGQDMQPMQRVMTLARVSLDQIKEAYRVVLGEATGNPFKLARVSQAFQVLSSGQRGMYDLKMMEQATSVSWLYILTAPNSVRFQLNVRVFDFDNRG